LRCLYHGWKVDFEGNVVDRPTEPRAADEVKSVRHKAYPAFEAGGFVWIWMGATEAMRPFEAPAWASHADTHVAVVKMQVDCNWAQVLEGAIDSSHSSSLHSTDMVPAQVEGSQATDKTWLRPSTDKAPQMQVERTDYGFRYVAIRRPIVDPDTHDYLRITLFVAPFTVLIPPNDRYNLSIMNIPVDDTHTTYYFIAWSDAAREGIAQEDWRTFCAARVGIDLDASYRPLRTRRNNYLQDRSLMQNGSYTGIEGIPNQDLAMWETMGPIADRSRERLGASDIAIVQFRRIMVDAARKVAAGESAIGMARSVPLSKLRSFEGVVPKTTNWRVLGVAEDASAKRRTTRRWGNR
jgi:phthalate 4,5-dioxygenase oxygenase subunit